MLGFHDRLVMLNCVLAILSAVSLKPFFLLLRRRIELPWFASTARENTDIFCSGLFTFTFHNLSSLKINDPNVKVSLDHIFLGATPVQIGGRITAGIWKEFLSGYLFLWPFHDKDPVIFSQKRMDWEKFDAYGDVFAGNGIFSVTFPVRTAF